MQDVLAKMRECGVSRTIAGWLTHMCCLTNCGTNHLAKFIFINSLSLSHICEIEVVIIPVGLLPYKNM